MFGFLKKKLKEATDKFKKKVEEEGNEVSKEELEQEVAEEPKNEKKSLFDRLRKHKIEPEEVKDVVEEEHAPEEVKEEKPKKETKKPLLKKLKEKEIAVKEEPKEEKEGFFSKLKQKVSTKKINEEQFEEFFYDLEIALLENNVAMEVIEKIKEELKMDLVNVPLSRQKVENKIKETLEETVKEILKESDFDLLKAIKGKKDKPYVILFLGPNGAGKTTTIAKCANMLNEKGIKVVLVAADTFRKGSIEQLKVWGNKLNLRVISKDYGSDPASVCFDGISFGKAHNVDVLLIDTAGRQHSNENLMREIEKINKVTKPDLKLFIGESVAGNDIVIQVKEFNEIINIDGIILTKADVDEKGGAILSVAYVTGKPVLYLGVGQDLSDLVLFDRNYVLDRLGL